MPTTRATRSGDDPGLAGTLCCVSDPSPIPPEALLAEADWLHRLARAMLRDADRAHDVAQETLVVALSQPAAAVHDRRAWLQTIAQRLAARLRRTERRRARREQEQGGGRAGHGEHEAATAERLRLHRQLCDAVLQLPEPYRTAVSLRFFDDLPPRAIARQTGTSAAIARQRVHRGLGLLRERFDAASGDRDAWTRAFVLAGFGAASTRVAVLLPLFVMKKILGAAAALLMLLGAWWWSAGAPWWQEGPAPGGGATPVAADVVAPAKAGDAMAVPASARIAATAAFVVRAVDGQERPIAGAAVHRWRNAGAVEVGRTDGRGVATFAPWPDAGGVVVQGRGLQTLVQVVPELRGEVTVRLGEGRAVAGRVFEDGVPAAAGLELKLTVPAFRSLPEVPDAIRELLATAAGSLTTATDANGQFAFAGLGDDWAGDLLVPRTHWLLRQSGQLVEDNSRLLVLAPDAALRVETTRLPTVRGRVEWSDGSGPVADAFVVLSKIAFADDTVAPSLGAKTDEQGRFALGLYPGAPGQRERWLDARRRSEPVRLQISAFSGSSTNVTLEAGGGPLDLRQEVVLRLPRPPVQRFRAVDERGEPLAGARALQGDGTLCEPTGSDGLGAASSPFGLYVGAPGRQIVAIRYEKFGQTLGSDPHEVVLVRGNSLRVRVRTATGEAAVGTVALIGKRLPGDRETQNLRRWLGESPRDFLGDAMPLDRRGEVFAVSLAPDVPCRLAVRDPFGGELAAQDLVTPAAGEERMIELTVAPAVFVVRGRVVDPGGAPAALASVRLHAKGIEAGPSERTAADGTFQFAPMPIAGDLVATVSRQGFAATDCPVAVAELTHELVLTLALARRTTVRVVDAGGEPVPEPRLVVEAGNQPLVVDQQQVGPGEYVCLDLPPGEVTFACSVAGARYEVRHDTTKPTAELRVPRVARVRIARLAGWPVQPGARLVAVANRLDEQAPPLPIELDDDVRGVPQLLLPGRYRIELAAMRWNYEHKRSDFEAQGPAAEIELRAGEVRRLSLQ